MGRPPAKDLTERELEVMHDFSRHGEATAALARERLAASGLDRTYTTIANLVRTLHDKGFLESSQPRAAIRLPAREVVRGGFPEIAGRHDRPRLPGDRDPSCSAGSSRSGSSPPRSGRSWRRSSRRMANERPGNDLRLVRPASVAVDGPGRGSARPGIASGCGRGSLDRGVWPDPQRGDHRRGVLPAAPGRPDFSGPSAPVGAADGAGGVGREAGRRLPIALVQTFPRSRGPGVGLSLPVAALRTCSVGSPRGTSAPLARVRPWGSLVAAAGLAGAGLGLVRLFLGLWAVQLCRRRGTIVTDPDLKELLEEIQVGIGCRREVEIRQVPDLVAPATAGWRHPVVLLPADWPSWDESTRRAVLAHELAHIQRRDYATGFVARLAVSLHFYHPLVYWMAGRLQLQQELAADAVGARFARGRGPYLLALSRLALRQEGRSPCWPARAFLPRGGH